MKEHKGMVPMKTWRFGLRKNLLSFVGFRNPDAPKRSLATKPPSVSQLPRKHTATAKRKMNRTELCAAFLVEMHHCATRKTHYLLAVNIISTSLHPTAEHQQDTESTPREATGIHIRGSRTRTSLHELHWQFQMALFSLYVAILR